MILFIDSTSDITVGLLNDDFKWLEYNYIKGQKGSAVIHKYIQEVLDKNNSSIEKLNYLIQVAGPGSYTGMRVSDGIKQIFSWQGIKTLSFYHYQVPEILGVKEGVWFCDAFKGESFLYSWNKSGHQKQLIKNQDASTFIENLDLNLFQLSDENKLMLKAESTQLLIKNNPEVLFKKIVESNIDEQLYYFRSLDAEFTKAIQK